MLYSTVLGKTLLQAPGAAETIGHALLLRAGIITRC